MTTKTKLITTKKADFDLQSVDGNAFSLLGGFRRAARKAEFTPEEIEAVTKEATSGDYDHLIQTLLTYTD